MKIIHKLNIWAIWSSIALFYLYWYNRGMIMDKLKIEYVNIDSIKPYSKNAKRHSKKQIEQIKMKTML